MTKCRIIDMETYERKAHFEHFLSMAYPYVGVTVNADVTDLVRLCRERGWSFFTVFLHAACLAADRVEQFRHRIRDGGVIEYETCPSSHTELKEDGTYCYCTLHHHMPLADYLAQAQKQREACRKNGSIEEDDDVESMYFITCLPWLHYTALIQPVSCGEESNPRISWGRYEEDAKGRLMMPVTVLVHHSLADGVHIGRFYAGLEEEIAKILKEAAG